MSIGVKSGELVTQVKLVQDIVGGLRDSVVWIDHRFARQGKLVRDEDGECWAVAEVYGSHTVDDLMIAHRAWKKWAEVLDG